MKMSEEVQYLMSSGIRLAIFCIGNLAGMEIILKHLLEQRRSILVYRFFWIFVKVGIQNLLLFHVMRHYFMDEIWYRVFYSCFVSVMAVVTYLVFYYTFEGGILKVAIAGMCVEWPAAFIGYLSLGIVNFLEKRSSILCLAEPFRWPDLLILVLQLGGVSLLVYFLKPWLGRYKHIQLRHRKILWSVFICYVASATLSVFADNRIAVNIFLYVLIVSSVFIVVIIFAMQRYRIAVEAEQELWRIQLNAMEVHYAAMQGQIRQMEDSQHMIEKQMKEITQLELSPSTDQKIAEYLKELKMEYEEIRAGVFCDDWMVDSVLYYYSEKLRQKEILFDCSMQGYQKGMIEKRDLIQLYSLLLDWGMQANKQESDSAEKRIYLHTSLVKKQLMINFFSSSTGEIQPPGKALRRYIKKYDGTVDVEKEQDGVRIMMAMKKCSR